MRAVKHTDLYLSYTDKCMIDANCCDSTVFGSPFIFPTRWLMHTGSAPGIVSMLKHSARKQQCCFSLQMYITHSSISLSIKGWGKLPRSTTQDTTTPAVFLHRARQCLEESEGRILPSTDPTAAGGEAVMPQSVECLHILHADGGSW